MEIVPAKIYYAKDGLINNKLKEYNDTLPQFIKYIKETLNEYKKITLNENNNPNDPLYKLKR